MDLHPFLVDLREGVTREMDRLDAGLLADDQVAAMTWAELSEAMGRVVADWETALQHAGHPDVHDRTECPVDGEPVPCEVLRRLRDRYRLRPPPGISW